MCVIKKTISIFIPMQFILPLFYSLVFILLIYKVKFFALETISPTGLAGLFVLKLFAGCIVYLVYTHYYSLSDFHIYFSDSKLLVEQWFGKTSHVPMQHWNSEFESVLFNNSRTMIAVNAILQFFSFGNLFVHLIFFCFFSFLGLVALYKAFVFHFPAKKIQIIISIFGVPSILFWSSAALKESLVITWVGLIIYYSDFGLKRSYDLKQKTGLLIVIVLLLFTKIYVALALLPVLFANWLVTKVASKKTIVYYVLVFAAAVFISLVVKIIHPDYNVLQLIADRQSKAISEAKGGVFLVNDKNFICVDYYQKENSLMMQPDSSYKIKHGSNYLSWKLDNMADTTFVTNAKDTAAYWIYSAVVPAKTVLKLRKLTPGWVDFIRYTPSAIFNVLMEPNIFTFKSWLQLIVAIENMGIVVLLILALVFYDKNIIEQKEIFLCCLIFALLLFTVIGITTPVIGSMVRYRTVGLLFFIPVFLMMIEVKKMKRRFGVKNRKGNLKNKIDL